MPHVQTLNILFCRLWTFAYFTAMAKLVAIHGIAIEGDFTRKVFSLCAGQVLPVRLPWTISLNVCLGQRAARLAYQKIFQINFLFQSIPIDFGFSLFFQDFICFAEMSAPKPTSICAQR